MVETQEGQQKLAHTPDLNFKSHGDFEIRIWGVSRLLYRLCAHT
jgi:hypothetical protein